MFVYNVKLIKKQQNGILITKSRQDIMTFKQLKKKTH